MSLYSMLCTKLSKKVKKCKKDLVDKGGRNWTITRQKEQLKTDFSRFKCRPSVTEEDI